MSAIKFFIYLSAFLHEVPTKHFLWKGQDTSLGKALDRRNDSAVNSHHFAETTFSSFLYPMKVSFFLMIKKIQVLVQLHCGLTLADN